MTARRRRRLFGLALLVALLGLFLVRLPLWSADLLSQTLAAFFHRPVSVGQVRYHLFPLEVEILDVRVAGATAQAAPFLDRVLHHPSFEAGDFDTGFVEKVFAQSDRERERPWDVAVAAAAIRAYRDRVQARGAGAIPSAAASGWVRRDWRRPEGAF